MPSPADEIVQDRHDVERIARELVETFFRRVFKAPLVWEALTRNQRDRVLSVVAELLARGVIRVGRRPEEGPAQMPGQTEFEEGR